MRQYGNKFREFSGIFKSVAERYWTYVLQTKRLKFYRDESDPACLFCGNAEETIQHFILDCQKLESERTKILMEISATWQNIQNCEMSFTELDSNSQLQILLDSSNYNKVKIDPANATRIELIAIRLLFNRGVATVRHFRHVPTHNFPPKKLYCWKMRNNALRILIMSILCLIIVLMTSFHKLKDKHLQWVLWP